MSKTIDEQLDAMTPDQLASITSKVNEANTRRTGQQQQTKSDPEWDKDKIISMSDTQFFEFASRVNGKKK